MRGKVVHIKTVLNADGSLPEGVEYIGWQRSPKMNPWTHTYIPMSPWRNKNNRAYRSGEITLKESLKRFEEDTRGDAALMAKLPELEGKTLACYCAGENGNPEVLTLEDPEVCHGQVILRLIEEATQQ